MTDFDDLWQLPPQDLALGDGDVHVWRASLDLAAEQVDYYRALLAPDEQARADRFHFPSGRDHFIVAHGILRAMLARYLTLEPGELRFGYSRYGKPSLAEETGGTKLCFNLSHAHGLALYAVNHGREVGIDVEYVRADLAYEQIAERFFSPGEVSVLRSLPAADRIEAFFNCWTRKEAYIKARGEGLSHPLERFDVSLAPGEPAALLRTPGDPPEAYRWSLKALSPGPGFVAALAVRGHSWRLRCWQWPPLR
jgi:4'-phosphopantetheinyl transferase